MNEIASDGDVVTVSDVTFAWPGAAGFSFHIDHFSLARGERMLLLGPSGGGKSTFLSLLCGINVAQSGEVRVLGQDLRALSASARDRFRSEHIGVVFQMFNLLPYGSVLDNVVLPLSFATRRRARAKEQGGGDERKEAARLLSALALEESGYLGPASALSVGQQQRVAVARALIGAPELIVADEPTSALDRDRQRLFLDLLVEQTRAAGSSLIMVSHDEALAPVFDRVCALEDLVSKARVGP